MDVVIEEPHESPWLIWLAFLLRSGARDFAHRGRNTFSVLADLIVGARGASKEAQAATIYLLCRVLFHRVSDQNYAVALAAMIPVKTLAEAVEGARVKKSEKQIIRQSDDFIFWALLRSWRVERHEDGTLLLTVDLARLHADAMGAMPFGFDDDGDGIPDQESVTLPVQSIYRTLSASKPATSERDIDAIRPFFNDEVIRKAIAPVKVEHRRAVIQIPDPPKAEVRPTLTLRGSRDRSR